MPIYTYECDTCGERFEARQSFSDSPLTICPTCSSKIHRVIQPAGIVFKGSGFYVTDNRGKQNLATPGTKKDDAKPSEGGNGTTGDSNGSSTTTTSGGDSTAKPAAATTSTESTKAATSTPAKS